MRDAVPSVRTQRLGRINLKIEQALVRLTGDERPRSSFHWMGDQRKSPPEGRRTTSIRVGTLTPKGKLMWMRGPSTSQMSFVDGLELEEGIVGLHGL